MEALREACERYANASSDLEQLEARRATLEGEVHLLSAQLLLLEKERCSINSAPDPTRQQQCIVDRATIDLEQETLSLQQTLQDETKSMVVLEESLRSQVSFNDMVHQSRGRVAARCRVEEERLAVHKARATAIAQRLTKEHRTLRELEKKLRHERELVQRAREALKDSDLDGSRLRKDASFAKSALLSEYDFFHEQTKWLRQAERENEKLRRHANRIGSVLDAAQTKEDSDANASEHAQKPVARRRSTLSTLKSENLRLLQQMVNSMQLLEHEFTKE